MNPPSTIPARRLSGVILCQLVGVCLLIMGAKLWLIGAYSSPLPFLDQWQGEGVELLRPWLRGELRAGELVAPFNEHRILFSRLLVLGLFEANARQWDAQVQMVAGAVLHVACAFFLGALLISRLGGRYKWPVFGALVVLFGLPFDWQNTLWGFQSQFYFLILFTLVALWGLAGHSAGSARWWCGAASGLFACFSMGSGGFAGLALAGWLGAKICLFPEARRDRGTWVTLGLSLTLGALGFALYTPPTSASLATLQVHSPFAFIHNVGIHLSWPNGSPFLAVLACAPIAILFGLHLRAVRSGAAREGTGAVEEFLFPLGLWVALQAAALAYCRNGPAAAVISRYMDLLALGALVNFCALLRLAVLAARSPSLRWPQRATLIGAIAWTALAIAGLVPLVQRNLRLDLPGLKQIHRAQTAAVRQFITTDRVEDFGGKRIFGLDSKDIEMLAGLLRDPAIQATLPTGLGIRRVLVPPGPLSAASQALADGWWFTLGVGGLLCIFATINDALTRRREKAAIQPPTFGADTCRIPS